MNELGYLQSELRKQITRRWFFRDCGVRLGTIALASLLGQRRPGALEKNNQFAARASHFTPKAKRVIFLFQAGAPSHLELFDYKPELEKWNGKLPPAELLKGYRAAFINPNSTLLAPKFKFAKYGRCGAELSELLPYTSEIVD